MTAAPSATDPASWHRLNPRMLLVHPVIEIGRALPALIGVVFAGSSRGAGSIWGLAAAGLVALLSLTRWFTTRLRITTEHVQLRHGLLRRRTITTGRDRIRTVDVTSHLMHRLLGLARVVIGTGTNDRKGEGRIVLDGLTLADATSLRDELLHRRPMADSSAPVDRRAAVVLASLDRQWIRFAPFTLSGVLTGLVIWGFYSRVQSESRVNLLRAGPLRELGRALGRLPTATQVLVVLAALIVFVAVTSTIGYVLAFWNFRLVRHEGGTLQITRGLITTRATSIERRRLVGATISEPLPLRAVGGARTLVIATGLRTGRGAERGGEVLLPPAPLAAAEKVATTALDGTAAFTAEVRPHVAAARRRRLTRALVSGGAVLVATVLLWWAGAPAGLLLIGVAAVVGAVPLGADRYRSLGHRVSAGYLITRGGSIVRRRSALRTDAVIGWNVRSSFFQRRAGLTTITATTAAGRQGYRVLDLDAAEAIAIADEVTPGLLDGFRSPAPPARSLVTAPARLERSTNRAPAGTGDAG